MTIETPNYIPRTIAEIGCNHKGDMEIAKELVSTAAIFCKADVVKFQKRNSKELLTKEQYDAPHPNPANSYGDTYGAHREFLEFDVDQNKELKEFCDSLNIKFSTSVWDLTSAKEMTSLDLELLKIPSACNLHFEMLGYLCDEFGGEIHLSTGMTTQDEVEKIVSFFESKVEDVCLLEIPRMVNEFGTRVKSIGFSGHHLGISLDVAAVALGAQWVERHFTLGRTWKGTDHAASLEPDGMRRLVRDTKNVVKAMTYKATEILPIEEVQRDKLKWRG